MSVVDQLAPVVADALHDLAGETVRWVGLPPFKQAVFRKMTRAALEAARAAGQDARGLDPMVAVARALSDVFIDPAEVPRWLWVKYDWQVGYAKEAARADWLHVAAELIAAGQALKQRRAA